MSVTSMAMERSTPQPLPLPPRISASSSASSATVGALLTRAASEGPARECRSPRSILSRILRRTGGGGGGFGCRLRLPLYCSSGRASKEDDGQEVAAAPKVVGGQDEVRAESPRSSLQEKKPAAAAEALPASLGLGASLVLLLSKSAAELSRMAELRAEMERLVLDAKAEARGSCDRSSASDQTDARVIKEPVALVAGGGEDTLSHSSRTAGAGVGSAATAMDQMEAELEAELTRLQLASDDDDATPRRDQQLEEVKKSDADVVSPESRSTTCADNGSVTDDDGTGDHAQEDDDSEKEEDSPACHGGVPARVLERRLHELLRSRHEERIAELESELGRARRKLQEKEREVSRWRDTAKLVSRHRDESPLR